MKKNTILFIFFHFFSLSLINVVYAKQYTHEDVENLAKKTAENKFIIHNMTNERISLTVHSLDPRIHIKSCDTELIAAIPESKNNRSVNVKISCQSTQPWQLFVPVKIKRLVPVVITRNNLQKSSIIENSNTELIHVEQYKLRGEAITDLNTIIGAKLNRNLQSGAIIYKTNLCIVCKGDNVTIIAKGSSFHIKTAGIALTSGSLGAQIKVKNKRSNKVISAQVADVNKVSVNL